VLEFSELRDVVPSSGLTLVSYSFKKDDKAISHWLPKIAWIGFPQGRGLAGPGRGPGPQYLDTSCSVAKVARMNVPVLSLKIISWAKSIRRPKSVSHARNAIGL